MFLGDRPIGEGAGPQDQNQREEDGAAVGDRGVDDGVHDDRSFSLSSISASETERTSSPGATYSWPPVIRFTAAGSPVIHVPSLSASPIGPPCKATPLPGPP